MPKATEAIERYRQALNSLDRAAYHQAFTLDAMVRDPYSGRPLTGTDGLDRFFDGLERTWSQFKMRFGEPFASGDRVAVTWRVRATAHSGKTAEFAGINVFTLDESGRISQLDGYWDPRAMMSQLQ